MSYRSYKPNSIVNAYCPIAIPNSAGWVMMYGLSAKAGKKIALLDLSATN